MTTPAGNTAFTGIEGLYFAVLQDETDTKDTAATYGDVKFLSEAISIGVNPQSQFATLYANNRAVETDASEAEIQVQVGLKQLPLWAQALLFGHQFSSTSGKMIVANTDKKPYVAIGYCYTKTNGKKRFAWLYKCKASIPQEQGQSKSGQPQFNTPTINFSCIDRTHDGYPKIVADEEEGFAGGATWFDAVQEYVVTP